MTPTELMDNLASEGLRRIQQQISGRPAIIGISYGKPGQTTAIAVLNRGYVAEQVPGTDRVLAPLAMRRKKVSRIVHLTRLPKDIVPATAAAAIRSIRNTYATNDPARPSTVIVDWPRGGTVHGQLEHYLRDPVKPVPVEPYVFPEHPQAPGGRLDLLTRLAALIAAEEVSADPSIPLAGEYREQLLRVDADAKWRQTDGDDLLSAVLLAMARTTRGEIVFDPEAMLTGGF